MKKAQAGRVRALESIRISKGWTAYRMARELGITQTHYNYLVKHAKSVQFKLLVRLVDKVGVSWEELGGLLEREFKNE